jgi:hypothetical protein
MKRDEIQRDGEERMAGLDALRPMMKESGFTMTDGGMEATLLANSIAKGVINRKVMGGLSRIVLRKFEFNEHEKAGILSYSISCLRSKLQGGLNRDVQYNAEWWNDLYYGDTTTFYKIIMDNKLPCGQKFSRWFCRTFETQHVNVGGLLINELPGLASKRGQLVGVSLFIQNFYSQANNLRGELVLTTRPGDLLTISQGTPWSSCVRWDGEYRISTAVYLHDNHSAALYLMRSGRKIGRCLVYFDTSNPRMILRFSIQRAYGTFPTELVTAARTEIQRNISRNSKIRNKWLYRAGDNIGDRGPLAERETRKGPYIDLSASVSRHAELTGEGHGSFNFTCYFPVAICICCGREYDYDGMMCPECYMGVATCCSCGKPIFVDEKYVSTVLVLRYDVEAGAAPYTTESIFCERDDCRSAAEHAYNYINERREAQDNARQRQVERADETPTILNSREYVSVAERDVVF